MYGHEITSVHDTFMTLAQDAIAFLSSTTLPGSVLVNTFPILQHLPDWFPGTEFKRIASRCRQLREQMCEVGNRPKCTLRLDGD